MSSNGFKIGHNLKLECRDLPEVKNWRKVQQDKFQPNKGDFDRDPNLEGKRREFCSQNSFIFVIFHAESAAGLKIDKFTSLPL